MQKKPAIITCVLFLFLASLCAHGQDKSATNAASAELARFEDEYSSVRVIPARLGDKPGIAAVFEGTKDMHYYASPETAPAPDLQLTIEAKSDEFEFGKPVFPNWEMLNDPSGKKVEVYAGNFTVFVPIESTKPATAAEVDVDVDVSGIACTSQVCLSPFEETLQTQADWSQRDSWKQISLRPTDEQKPGKAPTQPIWFALGLAFLAGLGLNIMPCVWPVLPLIVMRIVEQARQSKGKSIAMGLTFCLGILLFFAALAGGNIVLQTLYGTVLQWGDQFRSPAFLIAMALVLVVLALFMFGLFTISLPASVTSKAGAGKGYLGAVAMGFLAAILSTPCSFGILAAAFAWAQAQPLLPATTAIMTIGLGMAVPYAVLTSMPGLLKRLPRGGRWMDLFKQAVGFVLLVIAVKLITALPAARKTSVLYFAVVLAFCVWMWGSWVGYATKPLRRWLVRGLAVAIAVGAGWLFLPAPAFGLIDWQKYDALAVEDALDSERPVLIKFTADWCLSCQTVEKTVYSRKDVARLIKRKDVLAIKADTTERDSQATLALKYTYSEPGVPVSILLMPGKDEPYKWRGIFFGDELEQRLEELPEGKGNGEKAKDKSKQSRGG
jgi:thiol:disulfide interchange protein